MTQPSTNDVVGIRDALPTDMSFIFSTWLRDLRHADGSCLPDDIWFPAHRELVNRVLSDPQVKVLIVHPTDAPNEILGYVVAEPNEVLWWVSIKPKFREKHGLCQLLLKSAQAERALAAFTTPDGKLKLKNQRRPRQLRPKYSLSQSPLRDARSIDFK
jgi:hypothetical protein